MAKGKSRSIKGRKASAPSWAPDRIEQWPINRLRAADRNVRRHPDKQIEQLRGWMRKYGFPKPILIRADGKIIAGHGRWEAAKLEKYKTVPCIVAPANWTDQQAREFAIIDNSSALNAEWDPELARMELAELVGLGTDPGSLGLAKLDLKDFGVIETGDLEPLDASPQLQGLSYAVVVRCRDEAHQGELLEKLEKEGLSCEPLIS